MKKINKKSINTQYFKRSYFALDGLWFAMVEKNFSLGEALKIDEEVWKVLPKIQAREVKKLLNLKKNTFSNFLDVLKIKLEAEGYCYQERIIDKDLSLLIKKCPWYEIIKKSQREYLLPNNICRIDFQTWVEEFHLSLKVKISPCICKGDLNCEIYFTSEDKKYKKH